MVVRDGANMTGLSANRGRLTTPSPGIPSCPDCKQQLSSVKGECRAQHFVPFATVSTTVAHNVPCFTSNHPRVGQQLPPHRQVPGETYAYPGTRVHASSPPAARTGIFAPPACSSTRPGTALAHPITPSINDPPSDQTPPVISRSSSAMPVALTFLLNGAIKPETDSSLH